MSSQVGREEGPGSKCWGGQNVWSFVFAKLTTFAVVCSIPWRFFFSTFCFVIEWDEGAFAHWQGPPWSRWVFPWRGDGWTGWVWCKIVRINRQWDRMDWRMGWDVTYSSWFKPNKRAGTEVVESRAVGSDGLNKILVTMNSSPFKAKGSPADRNSVDWDFRDFYSKSMNSTHSWRSFNTKKNSNTFKIDVKGRWHVAL